MSVVKESICGNKRFRSCDVVNSKCVNCGTSFVKIGDSIKCNCYECNTIGIHKVKVVWNDGTIKAICKNCLDNDESISDLYGKFVGEWVMYESVKGLDGIFKEDKTFTNQQMTERLNSIVDKIAILPKEQLKTFLRGVHGSVER